MAVIAEMLPERIKVCDRFKHLWTLHCKPCMNKDTNPEEYCDGCAIYDEMKKIRGVLEVTLRERNVVDDAS